MERGTLEPKAVTGSTQPPICRRGTQKQEVDPEAHHFASGQGICAVPSTLSFSSTFRNLIFSRCGLVSLVLSQKRVTGLCTKYFEFP